MEIDPNLARDIPNWEKKAMEETWIGTVASYPDKDNNKELDKYHVEKTGFGQIKITQEKILGEFFPVYQTPPENVGLPKKLLSFLDTIKQDGCPKGTHKQNDMCIPYKRNWGKTRQ